MAQISFRLGNGFRNGSGVVIVAAVGGECGISEVMDLFQGQGYTFHE